MLENDELLPRMTINLKRKMQTFIIFLFIHLQFYKYNALKFSFAMPEFMEREGKQFVQWL